MAKKKTTTFALTDSAKQVKLDTHSLQNAMAKQHPEYYSFSHSHDRKSSDGNIESKKLNATFLGASPEGRETLYSLGLDAPRSAICATDKDGKRVAGRHVAKHGMPKGYDRKKFAKEHKAKFKLVRSLELLSDQVIAVNNYEIASRELHKVKTKS